MRSVALVEDMKIQASRPIRLVSMPTDLPALLVRQQEAFRADPFPATRERRATLDRLRKLVVQRQDDIAQAISADFGGRHRMEVLFSEVLVSVNALSHASRHVAQWMDRRDVPVGWPLQPARAFVVPQPLGVVGVISPWNYPLYLAIGPLASALAAGNRVMLKLSEHTPATSEFLAALIRSAFAEDHIAVVNGGPDVAEEFSHLPFDHLLFTGSTKVGRQVMRAAAENLTPVTLELGGKSPAIVTQSANLTRAADDIAYGKWLNAGQTCVAPDYVLVQDGVREEFLASLQAAVARRWPKGSFPTEYTSVVNDRQLGRLQEYLDQARERGCKILKLESAPGAGRQLPPVLVLDPPGDLRLMQEEIFGPILPICSFSNLDQAISRVADGPKPLALYLFTRNAAEKQAVLRRTASGGVSINETLLHIVVDDLPFGGLGASGMGAYHGQTGFDTFSKLKPVFERYGTGLGVLTRPPYGRLHEWMRKILIR